VRPTSAAAATTSEVFERLAPLLLLRTLPLAAWDDDATNTAAVNTAVNTAAAADAPTLPALILDRMLAVGGDGGGSEHEDVRRVAAELHGRVATGAGAAPRWGDAA
jgi:hypothetical protein